MKKAQIRMGETIAVLIIFFFMLVMGVAIYISFSKNQAQTTNFEIVSKESIDVSQIVTFFPEVQCSRRNIVEDNCFDMYKLEASTEVLIDKAEYYYPLLKYSLITITEIYPKDRKWTLYNRTDVDSDAIMTFIPVLIFDPITATNSFGVLSVEYLPFYGT